MTAMAGASRMSSVRGLKARPHTATVRPDSPPRWAATRGTSTAFWASFVRSTASTTCKGSFASWPIRMSALTSFGKHEPPYPTPGNRNDGPMRLSVPMPRRTCRTSAPTRSQ